MCAARIIVGQSGGPTAAINASLAGVVAAARSAGVEVFGIRHGVEGLFANDLIDLNVALPTTADLELLRNTPASWLGSCRYRLDDPSTNPTDAEHLLDRLKELNATALLYLGGNDSMDTIAKLSWLANKRGDEVRLIGVPKTIDNDLVGTDHTPGFGSAARYVALSVREIARDADVYNLKSVTFVEIMGRDAGWLAAASLIGGADLALLPENPLSLEELIGSIQALLAEKNTVVVGVSEGLRAPDGSLLCEQAQANVSRDAFGHLAVLSGTARVLAESLRERLGCKVRAIELSTTQRCAAHATSELDLTEAWQLGELGVTAALEGKSSVMCALERCSNEPYTTRTRVVDVANVANKVRSVPDELLDPAGTGANEAMLSYLRPLIGELPPLLPSLTS